MVNLSYKRGVTMNKKMKQAIQEFAEKYAMHYGREYVVALPDTYTSFEAHYEQLSFDKDFFYELLHLDYAFSDYFSQKREELLKKINDIHEVERCFARVKENAYEQTQLLFKEAFAKLYLDMIQEEMDKVDEELRYTIEDKLYFQERKYIGEEEEIGGPVSEEERTSMMKELSRKEEIYTKTLRHYAYAEENIKLVIAHELTFA